MVQFIGNGHKLRVWERIARRLSTRRTQGPSVLVKCGDCDQKVVLHFDGETLEINGVLSSWKEWMDLFARLRGIGLRADAKFKAKRKGGV